MNAVRSIVAGVFCLAAGMAGAAPLYQCPLTVSGYAEGKAALADFPVLVRISTAINGFSYGDCAAGGADISFTSEDGETVYPHEVDTWNPNGESLVWVKLPSMAHGTKFLFRWADQNPPTNDSTQVWPGYIGVWHFSSLVDSATVKNSATNDYDLKFPEGMTGSIDANAPAGMGLFIESGVMRTKDYEPEFAVGSRFTATGWFLLPSYAGTGGTYAGIVSKKVGLSWNANTGWYFQMNQSKTMIGLVESGGTETKYGSLPDVTQNWNHFALICDGTYARAYFNGSDKAGIDRTTTIKASTTEFQVGSAAGYFDEYRLRKGAVSVDWARAEYETVATEDYLTVGTTEILSPTAIAVSSDGLRYGVVSPDYGLITEPVAGTTYDFSCTTATQTLNEAGTTRAVCTGWELRKLSNGELIKSSLFEGERQFSCSHEYIQDEGVELRWLWTVQHLVTAKTATAGGTVAPAAQWIDAGSVATIVPTQDSGCAFYRWSGDLGEASPTANPLQLTVDAPKTVSAAFLQTSFPDYDHVFFVSTGGNDGNGGTTLDAAVKTVAKGLELAKASVAEGGTAAVVVTPGTYAISSALAFDKPVAMIGQCDAEGTRPTIDGANTYRTLKLTHADARVENLRLYRGYVNADGGGGGLNMSAGTVVNCEFADCYSAGEVSGGSITLTGGKLSRCSVHGGYTVNGGGNGAGAYVNGSGVLVEHCIFYGNSQNNRQGATTKIGAVYLNAGTVRNCTIVNNNMGKAGGIYVAKGAKFYDSIVWGNVAQNDTSEGAPNWQMASGAYVTNICTSVAMGETTVERDLTAYPNFKDLAANDCRLMPGSPCIDAGSFAYPADALDLAGNPRTTGTATDLGAYELDANEKAVGIEYSITGNLPGETLTYSVVSSGFGEEEIAAYWNFSDAYPTAETHDAEGLNGTLTLQAGVYSISLTVVSGGQEYHYQVKSGFTVYGMDMRVVDGNPNAKPPYDTWENAAANIADAVALATDDTVITLSNGTHKLTKPIDFLKAFTVCGITGDPKDVTVDGGNKMLCADIKSAGAVIRDIRLYNGKHVQGGVVSMTANGTVDHCIIDTGSSGGNASGGCVYMSDGTISRSIVKNGHTTDASGHGDGVYMDGGTLEHSLITKNSSSREGGKYGGGVYLNKGLVRNCTIYGNTENYAGGIYVGANGNVIDTIVWGNTTRNDTTVGAPNFQMASGAKVTNCWSAVQFGVTVGDFKLYGDPGFTDAAGGDFSLGAASKCKDAAWGEPTVEYDLAGSNRVQGAAMDLGCYEADPNVFSVDFDFVQNGTVDAATNVFTLMVSPEGTDLSNTQAYWTFDGRVPTAEDWDAKGLCVTNVFGVGTHDVALLVIHNGMALAPIVKPKLFKVYASLVCLDAANTEGAAKPWNTWANAATDINEIVPYLTDHSLVLIKPGSYPVNGQIYLQSIVTIRGVAADGESAPTMADRPSLVKSGSGAFRCFRLGNSGLRVEHLKIKNFNGGGGTGGAVLVEAGTLADCTISGAQAGGNTPGGGVSVVGGNAKMLRCSIDDCQTTTSSVGYHGGGVYLENGRIENCLIRGCKSNGTGGAHIKSGTFINCIVTNCSAVVQNGSLNSSYTGGVCADGGTVANCAIYGNKNGVGGVDAQVRGAESRYRNNALAYAYGSNCVTNDPRFADAAHGDWHIGKDSPLVNAGVNIDYTADSVDFEGNPRIFKFGLKSSKPDIGIYETPWGSPGMLLMVR